MMIRSGIILITAIAGITAIISCKKTERQSQANSPDESSIAQAQQVTLAKSCSTLQWVKQVETNAAYQSMALDGKGNIYVLQCAFKRIMKGYYIVGHTITSSLIEKIDPKGNIVWFYQPSKFQIAQIKADPQGNIYALSQLHDDGDGSGHAVQVLQKISPAGQLVWQAEVGNRGYGTAVPGAIHTVQRFAVDPTGNTLLIGNYSDNNTINPVVFDTNIAIHGTGMFATAVGADGIQTSVKTNLGASGMPVDTVVATASGNLLTLGNHSSGGINQLDFQVFDKLGNKILSRSINTTDPFIKRSDCSLVASGTGYFAYSGNHIFKFDSNGNMIFKVADKRKIDTSAYNVVQHMATDSKGNLYFGRVTQDKTTIDLFNPNGTYLGANYFPFGGIGFNVFMIDKSDQLYFGGSYEGYINLDAHTQISRQAGPGGADDLPSLLVRYSLGFCN